MSCNELPFLENTRIIDKDIKPPFQINEQVWFQCYRNINFLNPEYFNTATCTLNENNIAERIYDKKCDLIGCGVPPMMVNSIIDGYVYTFPNSVIYYCKEGFKMINGNQTINIHKIYCTATGKWRTFNSKIKCVPITCPNFSNPTHGMVNYNVNIGHKTRYKCNDGFKLIGNDMRYCTSTGQWDVFEPTCEKIQCTNPGPYINCTLSEGKHYYDIGDILTHK